jgi:hypothetical protein
MSRHSDKNEAFICLMPFLASTSHYIDNIFDNFAENSLKWDYDQVSNFNHL